MARIPPLLGLAVLCYLFGALSANELIFPYKSVHRGLLALEAHVHKASLGLWSTRSRTNTAMD